MSRRLVLAAFCLGLAACASILGLGDYDVGDPETGPLDGGSDAAIAPFDATLNAKSDTGADAGIVIDEGGCATLVRDDFTNPDPRWVPEGVAGFDGGVMVLVTPPEQRHGAMFLQVPANLSPATSFTASFTTRIVTTVGAPVVADGAAMVWASDVAPPHIGGKGQNLGFCPDSQSDNKAPIGAAFMVKVSPQAGVATRESDGGTCSAPIPSPLPPNPDEQATITISVSNTAVTATIDGTKYNFTLKSAVPIRWIGFSAATGGGYAEFSVDDVTIKVCR